ncbi:MAG TPA: ROK family protein [Stellaceae bacterium]|nr:ROK family protein [Stellaceae bacterium]
MADWRIGIDLGGTKIVGILLDPSGQEIARQRVATPDRDDATAFAIRDLVRLLDKDMPAAMSPASVGIGMPGAVSSISGPRRHVDPNAPKGQPFQVMVAEALGRKVEIANDANCFALSEAVDGSAAGASIVFGAILGTGVGGGIVVNGRILNGPHGIAGEWGHNPLPWPRDDERLGRRCYCGQDGCIETYLSGPGMAADHEHRAGRPLPAIEIFKAAESGDQAASETVERYLDRAARAFASIINFVDPDVIVLGGGMSNEALLYREIPKRWGKWAFTDHVVTRLVPPRHGDASGVRGAAWLNP